MSGACRNYAIELQTTHKISSKSDISISAVFIGTYVISIPNKCIVHCNAFFTAWFGPLAAWFVGCRFLATAGVAGSFRFLGLAAVWLVAPSSFLGPSPLGTEQSLGVGKSSD